MDAATLAGEALRRKLPEGKLKPGTYPVRGTALVDVDAIVTKQGPCDAAPNLPWRAIAVVLLEALIEAGVAKSAIMAGIRRALKDHDLAMDAQYAMDIEELRAKLPKIERAGATQIAGTVELVGFAEADMELPGLAAIKQTLRRRKAA